MSRLQIPVLLILCLVSTAVAQPYAVEVLDFSSSHHDCDNCDPSETLGAPDGTNVPVDGFYSIGALGHIELRLGEPVLDLAGDDFIIWEEITRDWDGTLGGVGETPDETADISLSLDGLDWTFVGQVVRGDRSSMSIDIAGSGMSGATFVRVVDVSGFTAPGAPGFDLDAVEVIPEPGTLLLLGVSCVVMGRRVGR